MGATIVFVMPVLIAAAVFIGIGIFALRKETPMHFWSGTTVKKEDISDIESYNRENGFMWILYGSTYVLAAVLTLLFGSILGAIIVTLSCTVGLIVLVFVYGRIYKKYKK
ncbi:MAG: hypothetical protein JJT76_10630 [Clostridiaceae bacterium]|nr:hypothetical protein [Clostridiaceae bacterium]